MAQKKDETPQPFNVVKLAHAKVLDEAGQEVVAGKLWQRQTAVFIFLRHFACIACRTHATQIWKDREKYQSGGAKIIFIGNGSPDFINKFREDLDLGDAAIYTDPTLECFRAVGFKRGFLAALGPQALANGIKMFAQGNSQGAYSEKAGDLWQLGGIVVIRPSGELAYYYISQALGDFPPEADVVR